MTKEGQQETEYRADLTGTDIENLIFTLQSSIKNLKGTRDSFAQPHIDWTEGMIKRLERLEELDGELP